MLKAEDLENEAFVSDWINRSYVSSLVPPERVPLALGLMTSMSFRQDRDRRFSPEGFENALKNARKCFANGKISEMASLCLRVLLPLTENNLPRMKDITQKLVDTQQETIEQHDRFNEERFGTYFRVKYTGDNFPDDIRDQEFIVREAMAAKLPEVTEKLRQEASELCDDEVEVIKESSAQSNAKVSVNVIYWKLTVESACKDNFASF